MKKILLLLFLLLIPIGVSADHIYSIDMDIDIDKNGDANVVEVWDVKASSGSEWYKTMYDLEGSQLTDFVVYMDGVELKKKYWLVNESLRDKAGYYGVNTTSDGIELCFGKSDMNRHKFTLKYKLSNYIFNTDDSQVLYWTLIPKITLDNFSVDVSSYYSFPDSLDVWGYGYKGYAYVKDGRISMSNENNLYNQNVVLLAKFPKDTFDTNFRLNNFNLFDEVYNEANYDSFEYNYDYNNVNNKVSFYEWLTILLPFVFFMIVIFKSISNATENGYGYVNNKKIKKKDVLMFRDIPCNKDIYYANILIKLNGFGYSKFNILGAIILKWVKEGKIKFYNKEGGLFRKDTSVIDLNLNPTFDVYAEENLFKMMYSASRDGILEAREFEMWASNNYDYFLELFNSVEENVINSLKADLHIYNRITKKECKHKNVMDDQIYKDSLELYGLKKYLDEFSSIDTKEVMEVKLWDEYLMFAYLFGIADKVSKQLKDLYPELLQQTCLDYDTLEYVDRISRRTISSANSAKNRDEMREAARSAARSYSSGGGGYSRGGGGRSSRGGGSRGSAGGR